ncbi:TRAP transporter large permease [Pararhodobacter zhoushanensis]|uniref:TRAP transporter large permease protein n=1 Tax=Pararhodobacter zhoushanensis TaxID=2479545 RepID=A0ABT3GXT7_9RHOB|nr:TRAP transporter large permease [Pararhodobacter zhoushanensis]MCW1932342.1 TRAP transporter large permease [Pararhodobacter zhoushanensis]
MDALQFGLATLGIMLTLIALRVPIGVALGVVSVLGLAYVRNFNIALSILRETPFAFAASWDLTAIPMFLLMGAIANHSGISSSLFRAARLWFSALPGGLAVAANMASVGFAAACGSSLASSAAMGRLAIPEMLRVGYDRALATGVVASAGTLAALIPPSIMLVLYGVFAEVSISRLLIAGIVPGILTATAYVALIVIRCKLNPALAPKLDDAELATLKADRMSALREVWPVTLLILGIIGGLYGGIVTPTEAGATGAALALVIALVQRRITMPNFVDALRESMSGTAQIFFVGMGAVMYTRLLSLTGVSSLLADMVGGFAGDPILVILAISVVFLVLGMFLDPLGIMLITLPVFLPMMKALDLDLIWFGIIVVKYVEIGMITPPLGMNVFVVKSVVGDSVPIWTIYRGVLWFLLAEVVVMALLISFPQITLFLPDLMR